MMTMMVGWMIIAAALFLFRPQSLRNSGDEKPAPPRVSRTTLIRLNKIAADKEAIAACPVPTYTYLVFVGVFTPQILTQTSKYCKYQKSTNFAVYIKKSHILPQFLCRIENTAVKNGTNFKLPKMRKFIMPQVLRMCHFIPTFSFCFPTFILGFFFKYLKS